MSKTPEVKIGINHQPLKEYTDRNNGSSRLVYMQNGDNFEILLYNPLKETVGVAIEINGSLLMSEKLVLYPGQSYWLDCNPENLKKFHFTEYEVEATKNNLDAVADNGKIKIEFYKENKPAPKINLGSPYWHDVIWDSPRSDRRWYTSNGTGDIRFDTTSMKYSADPTVLYSQVLNDGEPIVDMSDGRACLDSFVNDKELTGRVDFKGDSDQKFKTVDVDFEYYPSHTFHFRILPKAKQVLAKDIKQYCTKCGRRRRKSENFCPRCGNKL